MKGCDCIDMLRLARDIYQISGDTTDDQKACIACLFGMGLVAVQEAFVGEVFVVATEKGKEVLDEYNDTKHCN